MSTEKQEAPGPQEPAPLSEHEKAMRGIVGTPKSEVDAEARKEQRRKAKGKNPKQTK